MLQLEFYLHCSTNQENNAKSVTLHGDSTSPALVQKVSTTAVVWRERDPQIGFCRWLPLLTDVCLVLLSFSGTCAQLAQGSSTGITNEHQKLAGLLPVGPALTDESRLAVSTCQMSKHPNSFTCSHTSDTPRRGNSNYSKTCISCSGLNLPPDITSNGRI